MNSSLLVPALIVVAVTAGVFVFGDSLFSGGESAKVSEYAGVQPKVRASAAVADVKASASVGSDFSWDETTPEPSQSPITKQTESFVGTKQSEEAPGALYDFANDSQTDESDDSATDLAAADFGLSGDSSDLHVDDIKADLDIQTASKEVDDDLGGFFSKAPKATGSDSSVAHSSKRKSVKAPVASKAKTVAPAKVELAVASPKSSDAFDNFDPSPSDFTPAPRSKVNDEMKSVVMAKPKRTAPKKTDVTMLGADSGSVIPGALEPMKSGNDQPAMGGINSTISAKTPARKFKITNPKETALTVTLSVDGKHVTLKPDQSYVVQESAGDVEVSFSRGGSFGFEKKTLKKGHYRFTVSREAGWQLVN